MFKARTIYLFLIIIIVLGFVFYYNRVVIKDYFSNLKKVNLPQEISYDDIASSGADLGEGNNHVNSVETLHATSLPEDINNKNNNQQSANPRTDKVLKTEALPTLPTGQAGGRQVNLKVPFTIQSPDQKWNEPYKEACEEASILMVYSFLKNKPITVETALRDLSQMVDMQMNDFGGHYDLSASSTTQLAKKFFGLNYELIEIKSVEDIKKILSSGSPLILPTLGRELHNPNFKTPGPIYHMLVVKGYTKDGLIITNDPGTRKGKDYTYNSNILFNAIGDWDYNIESPNANKKVGIILK